MFDFPVPQGLHIGCPRKRPLKPPVDGAFPGANRNSYPVPPCRFFRIRSRAFLRSAVRWQAGEQYVRLPCGTKGLPHTGQAWACGTGPEPVSAASSTGSRGSTALWKYLQ